MALHWLFPTPVLQVDLEPDAATAAAMQQQLEQFDAQVYQHPEFSDRNNLTGCLLYTSPSPRDGLLSRMPSSA
jgi:hypothetical protein